MSGFNVELVTRIRMLSPGLVPLEHGVPLEKRTSVTMVGSFGVWSTSQLRALQPPATVKRSLTVTSTTGRVTP